MSTKEKVIYEIKGVFNVDDIKANAKVVQNSLKGIKLPTGTKNVFTDLFAGLDRELDNFEAKMQQGFENASDVKAIQKNAKEITKIFNGIIKEVDKLEGMDFGKLGNFDTKEIKDAQLRVKELKAELSKKIDASGLKQAAEAVNAFKGVSKNKNIQAFFDAFKAGNVEEAEKHLNAFAKTANNFKAADSIKVFNENIVKMKSALAQLKSQSGLGEVSRDLKQAENALENLETDEVNRLVTLLQQLSVFARQAAQETTNYVNVATDGANQQRQFNDEVDEIKNKVKYFFTLANGVELFKRAVRDAYQTVKDLDAAMTETAVVTDFTVGDMWNKLPEYADAANKLGATIQGAYETMTLFYQQGLNTNEAFALGTETMKMARIAGLDYVDATNLMTAALRGFKMELNEVSAQRVNDVYSELAAISASDTNEIANAMTKTASIAEAANMEFETTAAFLTQMIETTREPAENLGTAMKTIIARFTEMKKAPSDIFEVDGEEVNVNKVDAALASVGVALKNTKGEFRDLDDVFIELAEKWDSLDIMSQRYVATMAAGSRQQSRFIAMMSDYGRTMELVDAAQNSAGASQKQFEKTQESLEAKINKLKNAWQEFVLGLANNDIIKGAVDLLTKFLEALNDISDSSNGTVKSFQKIAIVLGAFLGGKFISKKIEGGLANILGGFLKKSGLPIQEVTKGTKSFTETIVNASSKVVNFAEKAKGLKFNLLNVATAASNGIDKIVLIGKSLMSAAGAVAPFLAVAAAVAGLAIVLKATYDAAHKYEQELEDAKEATERATTAAEDAKQAYEELQSVFDNYDKGVDALKSLEKGTVEWKEQLLETNQVILDLLEKYPGLADYISNKEGVLSLEPGGQEYVIDAATAQMQNTQVGKVASQIEEAYAELNSATEILEDNISKLSSKTVTNWSGQLLGLFGSALEAAQRPKGFGIDTSYNPFETQESTIETLELAQEEVFSALVKKIEESPTLFANAKTADGGYSTDFERFADSVGMTAGELFDLKDSILEYQESTIKAQKTVETLSSSMLSAGASAELLEDDLGEKFIETFSKVNDIEQFSSQVAVRESQLQMTNGQTSSAMLTKLNDLGLTDTYDELKNLQNIYQAMTGQSIEQIEQSFGENASALRKAIATMDVGKEMSEAMNNFYENYGQQESARKLIEALNQSSVELALNDKIDVHDLATSLGISEKELDTYAAELGYDLGSTLQQALIEKSYTGAMDMTKLVKGINSNALKKYLNSLTEEEYQIAIQLIEDEQSFDNFESFKARVESEVLQQKVSLIIQNVQGIDLGLDALVNDGNLDKLEEEELLSFQMALSKTKDIYNENLTAADAWINKQNEGLLAQIGYLNEIKAANLGIGDSNLALENKSMLDKASGISTQIKELQVLRDKIQEIVNLEGQLNSEEIQAQLKIYGVDSVQEAKKEIDDLNNRIEGYGWDINIEMPGFEEVMDYVDGVIGELTNLQSISSKIGEGFTASISDVNDLADAIPGILENATVTKDGVVQLNKEVVQDTIKAQKAQMEADHAKVIAALDGDIAELKSAKEKEQIKLNIAAAAYNEEETMDIQHIEWIANNDDKLVKYLSDNGIEEGKAYAAVQALKAGDFATYKEKVGKGHQDLNKTIGSAMVASGKTTNSFFTQLGTKARAVLAGVKAAFKTAFKADGITVWDAFYSAYNSIVGSVNVKEYSGTIYDTKTGTFSDEEDYNKAGEIDENKTELRQEIIKYQANLDKYDSQIQALENKKNEYILQHKYALAQLDSIGKGGSGDLDSGSSKGSKKEPKLFDASKYDESNNLLQQIDTENDRQKRLQQAYDNLVEDDAATLQDLTDNLTEQEESLLKEQALNKDLVKQRKIQLDKILADGSQYSKYATFKDGRLVTNDALIQSLEGKSAEDGSFAAGFQKYYDKLEKAAENYQKANDLVLDTEQDLLELRKTNAEKDFKDNRYKNSYDWLYNVMAELERLGEDQELLEKEYSAMLENRNATGADIANNLSKQKDNLSKQISMQKEVVRLSELMMTNLISQNKDLQKYATYDWTSGKVEINIEQIETITSEEEGQRLEEFISKMEELNSNMTDARGTLLDIESSVQEIERKGMEERLSLEDRILQALIQQRQEEIDKLQEINDDINEGNDELISSMRESLDKMRQERENEKKEQSIVDKQTRLAYLRRDTTGANEQEILQLEKELAEENEDYTDTLIDQKLSRIEEQNEEARTQRENQIQLLEKQLEELEKSPDWNHIYKLIEDGTNATGQLISDSELVALLKNSENFNGMSQVAQMKWLEELEQSMATVAANTSMTRQLEDLSDQERGAKVGGKITFTNSKGEKLTGTYNKDGSVTVRKGDYDYTYQDVYRDYNGDFREITGNVTTKKWKQDPVKTEPPKTSSTTTTNNKDTPTKEQPKQNTSNQTSTAITKNSKVTAKANALIYDSYDDKTGEKQTYSKNPNYIVTNIKNGRAQVRHVSKKSGVTGWIALSDLSVTGSGATQSQASASSGSDYFSKPSYTGSSLVDGLKASVYGNNQKNWPGNKALYNKIGGDLTELSKKNNNKSNSEMLALLKQGKLKKIKQFLHGGLVDFTGPAWLDGTKSRPEAFLNAKDTQNFMILKDVLEGVMNKTYNESQPVSQQTHFEINVQVDSISNDYDVDRLVNRVKTDILSNSQYRNVASLNLRK